MIAQLRFRKEDDDMLYTSMYLRRQVIRHFLHNFEEFFDEISEDIKYEYGRIDLEVGAHSTAEHGVSTYWKTKIIVTQFSSS